MTAGAYKTELSDVQRETWRRFAEGVPIKVIAIEQNRHVATIEARLSRVRDALGVDSRLGLIKAAVEHGLIEHGEEPVNKPGRCPCCGSKLPELAMRALVMFWHGFGYLEVARRFGMSPQALTEQMKKLKERFGGRGSQHYVAAAVRSGLMRKLLDDSDDAFRVGAGGDCRAAKRPANGRGGLPDAHVVRGGSAAD